MAMRHIFATPLIFLAVLSLLSPVHGEDGVPDRVITLAPSYDEILIELGLKDKIVGVTTSSDYLPEMSRVDRIGMYIKPNLEKIISLKPDIVFATDHAAGQAIVEKLASLGIKVQVFETRSAADIFATVRRVGEIFHIQKESEALAKRMTETIERTRRATEKLPRPRVYVETGTDPLFTCGRRSFIHDLVEAAGGTNIAGEIDQPFPQVSSEFILSSDPEVIILPYMGRSFGKEAVSKRGGWASVSAVKTGRVYDDLDSHVITIPSPRLILYGLPELLKRIHPEALE